MPRTKRDQQKSDQKTQDRAKEIYRWALENKAAGSFKRGELPGPNQNCMTARAVEILVSRGLFGQTCDTRRVSIYSVRRVVDPRQIFAIAPEAWRGVTIYKVPPGIARDLGRAPDLQKYAIGEIVSC
jgi:hypothetical protein